MMPSADELVKALDLQPHPEGGFYREIYRSSEKIAASGLPARYGAPRSLGTSIYYLLRAGDRSRLHRLKSDEIWHFHAGGRATIHMLLEDGTYQRQRLGIDVLAGERPQVVAPRGCWFGATVDAGEYVLVGCTVFPGFDFADFELATGEELLRQYPRHRDIIHRLTR